jgi:hypothetical protein
MDGSMGEAIANRDEAIPIVLVQPDDDEATPTESSPPGQKRDALKRAISPSKLRDLSPSRVKEKLEEVGDKKAGSNSLHDRMFNM